MRRQGSASLELLSRTGINPRNVLAEARQAASERNLPIKGCELQDNFIHFDNN
jgi:hypothetical protein